MMATLEQPERRSSAEFVDAAVLEAFVPAISNANPQELFESWVGESVDEGLSIVPSIEQRQFLLLDELIAVYVVLRTPALRENDLKLYLSRLTVTLEAHAVGQQVKKAADGAQPQLIISQVTELLASETVKSSDDPLILATEIQPESDDEPVQYIYVFWKVLLHLGRPRAKLLKLGIFFAPSASFKPPDSALRPKSGDDDYLPSQQPAAVNLLQLFANDPALAKSNARLSASRLTKQAPAVPAEQLARPIRNGPRRIFPAAPAFLWRVRFSNFPALTEKDSILACFDLETTQFAGSDLMIESVSLRLSSGAAKPIHVELPRLCRPGEQVTVIYKLLAAAASEMFADDASQQRTLTITASATVLVSKECTPKVNTKWKTALEIPKSRPSSRSGLSPLGMQSGNLQYRELPTTPGPDSLLMADQFAGGETASTISNGVSLTISGSKEVYVGEVFSWEVFIVNRSEKIYRFAILALPKRRLGDQHPAIQRPSQSDTGGFGSKPKDLARPILDDNVIYSLQKSEMMDPTELICLSPDVRMGSLGPTACYTAEIKFLPLASGVLHLEALRLVDLATQQTMDVRHLPDIVAIDRNA